MLPSEPSFLEVFAISGTDGQLDDDVGGKNEACSEDMAFELIL